jgi:hypothetical protein
MVSGPLSASGDEPTANLAVPPGTAAVLVDRFGEPFSRPLPVAPQDHLCREDLARASGRLWRTKTAALGVAAVSTLVAILAWLATEKGLAEAKRTNNLTARSVHQSVRANELALRALMPQLHVSSDPYPAAAGPSARSRINITNVGGPVTEIFIDEISFIVAHVIAPRGEVRSVRIPLVGYSAPSAHLHQSGDTLATLTSTITLGQEQALIQDFFAAARIRGQHGLLEPMRVIMLRYQDRLGNGRVEYVAVGLAEVQDLPPAVGARLAEEYYSSVASRQAVAAALLDGEELHHRWFGDLATAPSPQSDPYVPTIRRPEWPRPRVDG